MIHIGSFCNDFVNLTEISELKLQNNPKKEIYRNPNTIKMLCTLKNKFENNSTSKNAFYQSE